MTGPVVHSPDAELVRRLLAGEERAFDEIVTAYSPVMLHVARGLVSTTESAQDVVQDGWLVVIRSLDRFEGRSTLRTWILGITVNLARRRAARDARTVPSSAVTDGDSISAVDPSRFQGPHQEHPGGWTPTGAPVPWTPEQLTLAGEARELLGAALARLPERQRVVVSLRDVDGLSSEEVCDCLGISAGNQRVLLHRGRTLLRQQLEEHYRLLEVRA